MKLQSEIVIKTQIIIGISKLFNSSSKKRDLSDQSCNGEEPKKAKEGSLNDSNVSLDDVFVEGISHLSVYKLLSIVIKILRLK